MEVPFLFIKIKMEQKRIKWVVALDEQPATSAGFDLWEILAKLEMASQDL